MKTNVMRIKLLCECNESYGLRKERGNERRTGNSPDNLPYFIAKQR